MDKKIIYSILIILILSGIFFHYYAFNEQPILGTDEPIIITAAVQSVNGELQNSFSLVRTHPFLGYFLFGLPTFGSFEQFKELKDINQINYIYSLHYELFFEAIKQIRIMLVLAFLACCVLFYLICRFFYSPLGALAALGFFVWSTEWWSLSRTLYFEVPQLMWILLSILGLLYFSRNQKGYWLILACLSFGLAIGTRLSSLFLVPAIVFFLYKNIKENPLLEILSFLLACFISIISFFPNLWLFIGTQASVVPEVRFGFDPLPVLVSIMLREGVYLLALFFIICFLISGRKIDYKRFFISSKGFLVTILISMAILSCFVVSVNHDQGLIRRYLVLITIPVFFYAGWVIDKFL